MVGNSGIRLVVWVVAASMPFHLIVVATQAAPKIPAEPDSIAIAGQLGRLDLVAALLAAVGLAVVLGGIYGFMNFRAIARRQARETAQEEAKKVAARVAVEHLQQELPSLMEEYAKLAENAASADEADKIALAQDDGGGAS